MINLFLKEKMQTLFNKSSMMYGCLVIIAFLFTATSCGVMFGGSRYNGTIIVKDHPNADIYINGQNVGKGQYTKLFPRKDALQVEVRQDGCASKTKIFDKEFRTGNFILSVLLSFPVGPIIDLVTGACYKPAVDNDVSIEQVSTKNFNLKVDYSDCKQ